MQHMNDKKPNSINDNVYVHTMQRIGKSTLVANCDIEVFCTLSWIPVMHVYLLDDIIKNIIYDI